MTTLETWEQAFNNGDFIGGQVSYDVYDSSKNNLLFLGPVKYIKLKKGKLVFDTEWRAVRNHRSSLWRWPTADSRDTLGPVTIDLKQMNLENQPGGCIRISRGKEVYLFKPKSNKNRLDRSDILTVPESGTRTKKS
jgi:hypothetical protein